LGAGQEKNVVLIADNKNALQVLCDLVEKKSSPKVSFNPVSEVVGNLTGSDLELIKSTNSTVLIFGKIDSAQKKVLQTKNILFFAHQIIYELEKELDEIVNQLEGKQTDLIIRFHCEWFKKEIFCKLPKMNEQGNFIINGFDKVVVFQSIRAPGVYFFSEENKKNRFYGEIIPHKGS